MAARRGYSALRGNPGSCGFDRRLTTCCRWRGHGLATAAGRCTGLVRLRPPISRMSANRRPRIEPSSSTWRRRLTRRGSSTMTMTKRVRKGRTGQRAIRALNCHLDTSGGSYHLSISSTSIITTSITYHNYHNYHNYHIYSFLLSIYPDPYRSSIDLLLDLDATQTIQLNLQHLTKHSTKHQQWRRPSQSTAPSSSPPNSPPPPSRPPTSLPMPPRNTMPSKSSSTPSPPSSAPPPASQPRASTSTASQS